MTSPPPPNGSSGSYRSKKTEPQNDWILKVAITALISIVMTAGVAWFTIGGKSMTREEIAALVDLEIKRAPYPWLTDRNMVMQHVTSPSIHEGDGQKRQRIREEVSLAMRPVTVKLDAMNESLAELKRQFRIVNGQP